MKVKSNPQNLKLKNVETYYSVIPAQAGIQATHMLSFVSIDSYTKILPCLDSGLHQNDG